MEQLQFWCNFHLMHSKIARIVTSEVYCNYTHAQSYPTGAGGSSSVSNGVLLHLQYNTVVCCLQNTACLITGDVYHTHCLFTWWGGKRISSYVLVGFLLLTIPRPHKVQYRSQVRQHVRACDSLHPCESPPSPYMSACAQTASTV